MKFDKRDMIKALDTLRVDKAVGPDGLSPRLLKETKEFISYPLYLLFKKSFSEGNQLFLMIGNVLMLLPFSRPAIEI